MNDVIIPDSINSRMSDLSRSRYYIQTDLVDIATDFLKLGFHLKEVEQYEYYKEGGYSSVYDFCLAEFNLSRSSCSRFISICRNFSVNGNSMFLEDKYNKFSYSQLCELLSVPVGFHNRFSPDMTIAAMRSLKRCINYNLNSRSYLPCSSKSCPRDVNCCISCSYRFDCEDVCNFSYCSGHSTVSIDVSDDKKKSGKSVCDIAQNDYHVKEQVPDELKKEFAELDAIYPIMSWNRYIPGTPFVEDENYIVTLISKGKPILGIRSGFWMRNIDNPDVVLAWMLAPRVYEANLRS